MDKEKIELKTDESVCGDVDRILVAHYLFKAAAVDVRDSLSIFKREMESD